MVEITCDSIYKKTTRKIIYRNQLQLALEISELRIIFTPQILMVGARSSVVEQHPFKVKVGGSSPPVLTKAQYDKYWAFFRDLIT